MRQAYTLIELIIVISVLAMLTGLSSLSIVSYSKSSDINTSEQVVANALKEARGSAMADNSDKVWGVHLVDNQVIIFSDSGGGYNPADPTNSLRALSNNTDLSWSLNGGGGEIIFSKRTGKTNNYGTLTVTGQSQATKFINVNSEGLVE